MHKLLILVVISGCGSGTDTTDTTTTGGGGGTTGGPVDPPDMAHAPRDMAIPRDMKPPADLATCIDLGNPATSAYQCCSKEKDDFGNCCTGVHCCSSANNSHASGSQCVCDTGYVWASGATDDFTCELAPDHVVECGYTGRVAAVWCQCKPQDNNTGGNTTVNGYCEKDPSFAPMKCCASTTYPDTGTCTCWLSQKWRCEAFVSNECSCDYFWDAANTQYFTSVCNNVADAQGPWRCCNDHYGSCTCKANLAACKPGDTEVADCTNDIALGYAPAPAACPAGQTAVAGCSGSPNTGGGQCSTDSQCGSSCSGTDPVCCPTCKNGYCGQICCSSSGTCF